MQEKRRTDLSSLLGIMLRRQQKSQEGGNRRKAKNWPGKFRLSFANNLEKYIKRPKPQHLISKKGKENLVPHDASQKECIKASDSEVIFCQTQFQGQTHRNFTLNKKQEQTHRYKSRKPFLSKPLIELVQHQKLLKLQEEKDEIFQYLTAPEGLGNINFQISSSVIGRQTSANFRTFNCMSKLMEIKEKLFQTVSRRPKTCGNRIKK